LLQSKVVGITCVGQAIAFASIKSFATAARLLATFTNTITQSPSLYFLYSQGKK